MCGTIPKKKRPGEKRRELEFKRGEGSTDLIYWSGHEAGEG